VKEKGDNSVSMDDFNVIKVCFSHNINKLSFYIDVRQRKFWNSASGIASQDKVVLCIEVD
jgi:hypothetical protein